MRGDRTVNILTYADADRLPGLQVAGFFNPTLDLRGAEQEADAISAKLPQARVFKREAARLSALDEVAGANVIHLSMHGAFNAQEPRYSKLFFNGAKLDHSKGDPKALYAVDMARHQALQGRDLIFAAACQTGLTGADQSNRSELLGMLRYLTANRNRNVILSLWEVNDAATKEFVTLFYAELASTREVRTAFFAAQAAVRQKFPKPYYWAAFYLARST